MRRNLSRTRLFSALIAVTMSVVPAPAALSTSTDALTFTQFDVPGATSTRARGINDYGQIVGGFRDSTDFDSHGFLLSEGVFTTIDYPGGRIQQATGINKAGQIVGHFFDDTGTHGYLLDQGAYFTQIDIPGASRTEAWGINDRGQIVGEYTDSDRGVHGFLLHQGLLHLPLDVERAQIFTQVDMPGAQETSLRGIHNTGQMVGGVEADPARYGFLLDKGVFTQIDPFGATSSIANGINNSGRNRFRIVGHVNFGDGTGTHGYVRDNDGVFTYFDFPGANSTVAHGINTKGLIVGSFSEGGTDHGFVARPQ